MTDPEQLTSDFVQNGDVWETYRGTLATNGRPLDITAMRRVVTLCGPNTRLLRVTVPKPPIMMSREMSSAVLRWCYDLMRPMDLDTVLHYRAVSAEGVRAAILEAIRLIEIGQIHF